MSTIPRRLHLRSNLTSTVIHPSSVLKDVLSTCVKSYAERQNPLNKRHGQHRLKLPLKPSSLQKHTRPRLNSCEGMINLIRLHQPSQTAQRRQSITRTRLRTIFSEPLFFPWKDVSTIVWHGTMMKWALCHCTYYHSLTPTNS